MHLDIQRYPGWGAVRGKSVGTSPVREALHLVGAKGAILRSAASDTLYTDLPA